MSQFSKAGPAISSSPFGHGGGTKDGSTVSLESDIWSDHPLSARGPRAPLVVQAEAASDIRKVAMLGNHLPRQCGIATFTSHLSQALGDAFPSVDCFVLAMNESGSPHAYPPRVRFEISEGDPASYRRAADFLNVGQVDVLSVQHEYGIFGGKAGAHVLFLLRELRMPIVTTLHTILAAPNALQRDAMEPLLGLSERVVVMSSHGADLLKSVYGVAADKIDVIPHGIPDVPPSASGKRQLGVEGKSVILTFGLLSPDKGIEHVIDALPAILAAHPQALYVVLGATHPHVKARHGEAYRGMLEARARKLGVDSAVVFHNRFVSQDELVGFLAAADIYVTPYLQPEQSTSGTLAYAVGAGKAVISTPYAYARELLAEGRGRLVPWRDSDAIGREVANLLGDAGERRQMSQRAAAYGAAMRWPNVARAYLGTFSRARAEHASRLHTVFRAKTIADRPPEPPDLNLSHLRVMTDHTGILQHALFNVPRYQDGYCVDDNARALLLTTLLEDAGVDALPDVRAMAARYLAFLSYAFDAVTGRFHTFMTYSGEWVAGLGSEDGHGRALWALGAVVGHAAHPARQNLAHSLFHAALHPVDRFTSPRAWAYALLGIDAYLGAFRGDREVHAARARLAERLLDLYRRHETPAWPWFEDRATYCNARLPQALLLSGWRMEDAAMKAAGLRSLEWLSSIQRSPDGYFVPIGSNGFFPRGGHRAEFDQQPVEACSMVAACVLAQRVTGEARWGAEARRCFDWFLGQNVLQQPLYDAATGGCRDGLHPDRPNENQGAESTLSFLLALLDIRGAP